MARHRRPDSSRNRARHPIEWIGGRVSPPFVIENPEESYRPDLIVWMETASGLVVGHELVAPDEAEGAVARALLAAMDQPLAGLPRRPDKIRVADATLSAEVRTAVGDTIPITIAPTPELDGFLDAMLEAAALDREDPSYLGDGLIPPAVVEACFAAARILYYAAPWQVATDDQVLRMDIPALGVDGACVSIIGNLGESLGIILFPSAARCQAFVRAIEKTGPTGRFVDFGTGWLALNFNSVEELPASMRLEVEDHGWPVATDDAYPTVQRHDRDGTVQPLTERDLKIAAACASALATFFIKHRSIFEADEFEPLCESYFDEHDLEVRFTLPYEASSLFVIEEASQLAGPFSSPATQRINAKTGRNDPCPCGSGRKYKKCHLQLDEQECLAAVSAAKAHDLDRRMVHDLADFALARFGNAWRRFERDFIDATEVVEISTPWSVYHYLVEGESVLEWYLKERGQHLSEAERTWLDSQRGTWLSVWEVIEVEPGVHVTLRDLLSGETRRVHEMLASQTLVLRDAVLARIVCHGEIPLLCGVHLRPLPPFEAAEVVRRARGRLRRKRTVPVEKLRDERFGRYLIRRWEEAVDELDARSAFPPDLRNTDGEPILLTTDHFEITPGARPAIEAQLATLEGVQAPDAGEGPSVYVVLGPENLQPAAGAGTVVGQCHLSDSTLRLETNSRERADVLRARLEAACGDRIRHRAREHVDPLSDKVEPTRRDAAPELPAAEVEHLLREFKQRHYADWPDLPLPALNGETPRVAVQTVDGRTTVDVLLKTMENHEQRAPGGPTYDFGQLRRALQLE